MSRLQAGLSSGEIKAAAKSEIDSTFRVYVLEWVIDSRHRSQMAAEDQIATEYAGRLHPDDISVTPDDEGGIETYVLNVRQWVMRAEWKYAPVAQQWADLLQDEEVISPEDIKVVTRNSRSEHALKAYGKLLLPEEKR